MEIDQLGQVEGNRLIGKLIMNEMILKFLPITLLFLVEDIGGIPQKAGM